MNVTPVAELSPSETMELARKLILKTTRTAVAIPTTLPFNDPKLDTLVQSRTDVEAEMRAAFELLMSQYSTHTKNLLNAQRIRDVYVDRVSVFDASKVKDLPDDVIGVIAEFIGPHYVRLTSFVASIPICDILKRVSKYILIELHAYMYEKIMAVYRKECKKARQKYPYHFVSSKHNWHMREFAGELQKYPSKNKPVFIADIQTMITCMIALTDKIPKYLAKELVIVVRKTLLCIIRFDKMYQQRLIRNAARAAAKRAARKAATAATVTPPL